MEPKTIKMLGLFGTNTKKQLLALDIGSWNTKFMVFQLKKKGRFLINQLILRRTPEGVFQDGLIANADLLSDFLTGCLSDLKLDKAIETVVGVSCRRIIIKKMDIPPMDKSIIPEFVEMEATQEIFFNKEEMDLDYDILEGVSSSQPGGHSILAVAVLKKSLSTYTSVISKVFKKWEVLEPDVFALFNSFEFNSELDENNNYMVLDIGHSSFDLSISNKNQVVFARNVPGGGHSFSQGIQKQMNVDYLAAEELKISAGKGGENVPEDVRNLLSQSLAEAFSKDLLANYELYNSLFPQNPVHICYITGGASQTFGLIPHLKEKLGIPVEPLNPFQKARVSPTLKQDEDRLRHFFNIALGLALRVIK